MGAGRTSGSVILRDIPDIEAELRIVSLLREFFPDRQPGELVALVNRDRPIVLAEGVSASRGLLLVESLRKAGGAAEFLPDTAPGGAAAPTGSPASAARDGAGKRSDRRLVRALLLLVLCGATAWLFLGPRAGDLVSSWMGRRQIAAAARSARQSAEDYLESCGQSILKVTLRHPPGMKEVAPEEMSGAWANLLAPRPDGRFLLAFATVTRRWEQSAGLEAGTFEARGTDIAPEHVTLELRKGWKSIHSVRLPLPMPFGVLMDALEEWIKALEGAGGPAPAALGEGNHGEASKLINAVDPRFILLGLQLLDEAHRAGDRSPGLFLEAARAYGLLHFTMIPDKNAQKDFLAAEALAFLALARRGGSASAEAKTVEALVAATMDYSAHARQLMKQQIGEETSPAVSALTAFLGGDLPGLSRLASTTLEEPTRLFSRYLLCRLLLRNNMTAEAMACARGLLEDYDIYPAVVSAIYAGDLDLAKRLTVLYPLDMLSFVEAQVTAKVLAGLPSFIGRVVGLQGIVETDLISLQRFDKLLERWSPFGESPPAVLVDEGRAREVLRTLYTQALCLRFDLLLNRWNVPERAVSFARSVVSGSGGSPLFSYLGGLALRRTGEATEAMRLFNEVLESPATSCVLACQAYWESGWHNKYRLLPSLLRRLDGRPSHRHAFGTLLQGRLYDMDGALQVFEEVRALDPSNWDVYVRLAQTTGSDEPLLEGVRNYPSAYRLMGKAADYFAGKQTVEGREKALWLLELLQRATPSQWSVMKKKGQVLRDLGRQREAIEAYDRWLEAYPDQGLATIDIMSQRTLAYVEAGDPRTGLEKLGDAPESFMAGAMIAAGRCHEAMGQEDRAAAWYGRASERYPGYANVGLPWASFLWRSGRFDEAAEVLARCRARSLAEPYWFAREMAETFRDRPAEEMAAAMQAILKKGGTNAEASSVARHIQCKGRPDSAFAVMASLPGNNKMERLMNIGIAYKMLTEAEGKEAGSRYLRQTLPDSDRPLMTMVFGDLGQFEAILEEGGDPDQTPGAHREFHWLTCVIAWKAAGAEENEWSRRIGEHYSGNDQGDRYALIGRYLLGKEKIESVFRCMTDPKAICEASYYLGLSARLSGDFETAGRWYQACLSTLQENNGEYHWASNELYYWSFLGATGRNLLPSRDREDFNRLIEEHLRDRITSFGVLDTLT